MLLPESSSHPGVSMEAIDGDRPVESEDKVDEVSDDKFRDKDMVEGRHLSTSPRLSTLRTMYCMSP